MYQKVVFADFAVGPGEVKENSFETAFSAWYEKIVLTAGQYPLEGEIVNGKLKDVVWFSIPGIIEEDYFQSLYFGVPFGKEYDRTKNKGKLKAWLGHISTRCLAESILKNEKTNITLRPGFEARVIKFTYDGEEKETYGIGVIS